MIDPVEVTCPECGVTSDGLQHRYNCPVLVYVDTDEDGSEYVADDVPPFGTPPEIPDEAPRDPVPAESELDDCFRALMSHDVLPEG